MTPKKVREALNSCRELLHRTEAKPTRLAPEADVVTISVDERCDHAMWMCDEAMTFPDEKVEKMMRWLGFVQGVIWSSRIASTAELKRMNMPDEEKS